MTKLSARSLTTGAHVIILGVTPLEIQYLLEGKHSIIPGEDLDLGAGTFVVIGASNRALYETLAKRGLIDPNIVDAAANAAEEEDQARLH